jgi:glutathione S-transferase
VRRLLTIPISHYCEKARWALERAGLDYVEERHVQGIHQVKAKRAGGGMTVPVLVADEGVFPESEAIIRYADEHLPDAQRLFPAEPELRAEVEELCRRLDDGLGPDGRRLVYAHVLPFKEEMMLTNNQGVPAWEDRTMRAIYPAIAWYAKRKLDIGTNTIADDEPRVRQVFDTIAERLADGRQYLCADRFTAADLTFAALSSPVIAPPEYGIALPQPAEMPPGLARTVREFRALPAGRFALELYRTQRRAKVAVPA